MRVLILKRKVILFSLMVIQPPISDSHPHPPKNLLNLFSLHSKEERSMDQYRSRLKLSENFQDHWSMPISGEIHMDQSLVHTFSWGNSYGPMVLKVLQKFPPTLVLVHGWLPPADLLNIGVLGGLFPTLSLGIRLPYRGRNPKTAGKEGFGVKKPPFPTTPEKGALSQKIPIFLVECSVLEMGIFWPRAPFSGVVGNGGFLTPKPSFPDFGDFGPCKGQTNS